MDTENKKLCHDCNKEILVENEEIKNGVFLEYKNGDKKINIFKCNECFESPISQADGGSA